ncbi:MAG: AbrB/MazE/SpoVT family DNA-binding domain-containing protein [Acutalibacteraceae bacterium]|nr:AbrB/MazE/SpoVT family DNA-binding domain-containing protein [Acutalibacteraceae bacterium]
MTTGIIGKFDNLGRTVIPIELRRNLGDKFEIITENGDVILRKISDKCEFCGNTEDLKELEGKYICKTCVDKLLNK